MTTDLTLTSMVGHQREVQPAVCPSSLNVSSSPLSSIENSSQSQYVTRKRSSSDFQFLECIGEGSYSKVYRAVSKTNVHTYAIKVLNKQHIHKEKKRKYVTIEKNTLNVLGKHPGIVTLYYTFQDPKSLYFVIDYAKNGELLNLIHKVGSLSLELSQYYTIQLIDAVTFIHNKKIIHRDLKPENILLNNDWNLMITDFGAAKFVDDNENLTNLVNNNNSIAGSSNIEEPPDSPDSNSGSFVGTAEYISPELLRYNHSSFASDFWSLGCIIYQMLIGVPPFKSSNEYETFEKIVDLDYSFPDPTKYPIPSNVVSIIQNLLVEDPIERLNSATIKLHPWFKNVDWNNKSKIWGTVPKLEPYNPDKYFKTKKQPILQHQANQNNQLAKQLTVSPFATQKKALPERIDVDYINDKPSTVLKKQIINAQGNTQLMNKVLNNRIDEKNKIITKNLIEHQQDPLSGLQVNKKRGVNNKTTASSPKLANLPTVQRSSPVQTRLDKKPNRNSSSSLSSLLTAIDSSKSVIINPKSSNTPKTQQHSSFSSNTTIKVDKQNVSENILKEKVITKSSIATSSDKTLPSKLKNSSSVPHLNAVAKSTLTPSPSSKQVQSFIPKRVTSSDAAAAAGAIGTLLTHNRHLNSTSSTTHQYRQLQNHQKQMINPVLLDRQIPSIITSKLMKQETILKLDNIFKSEISHKPNQFKSPTETLNHSILEKIISKSDRDLEKDLKSCIMIVTSMARIFIYELNDNFKLRTPQSAIQMQAQAFYSKIIEIKLTNKNVSLYDYEFDEEMHEGYLILELSNVNKLIFLSAWDRSRLVKGGINSNVQVGFHVNDDETWVKSFLKAKNILRKRELAMQSTIYNNPNPINSRTPVKNTENVKTNSPTSSVQQSFRKLKINTQRIRSFSSSSKDNSQQYSQASSLPSVPSSATSEQTDSGTHNNSILSGVKELAQGVRSGFKVGNYDEKVNNGGNVSQLLGSASNNYNNGLYVRKSSSVNKSVKRENKMDKSADPLVNYRQKQKGGSNAALAAATAVGKRNY